jgi:hypothetical protein
MHFILHCTRGRSIIEGPDVDEPWCEGHLLESPPTAPLMFTLDPVVGDEPASMYDGLVPVWSDPFLSAMREAGVDNVEAHPAVLQDVHSGTELSHYWAVNVVGLVSAVDFQSSGLTEHAEERGDLEPEGFVLDQKKANRFRLFRLAESPDLLLVDEHVRRSIERRGLVDVQFTRPGPAD